MRRPARRARLRVSLVLEQYRIPPEHYAQTATFSLNAKDDLRDERAAVIEHHRPVRAEDAEAPAAEAPHLRHARALSRRCNGAARAGAGGQGRAGAARLRRVLVVGHVVAPHWSFCWKSAGKVAAYSVFGPARTASE